MSLSLFLSNRIFFSEQGKQRIARPGVKIAVIGIAVGVVVMLLSVAIVVGFKREVTEKVVGFGSHIQISSFESNSTYQKRPVAFTDSTLSLLRSISGVDYIQRYWTEPAILKTADHFEGIVLKGIDAQFNPVFFTQYLVKGDMIEVRDSSTTYKSMISEYTASRLGLDVGDSFLCYFMGDNIRARKLTISAIYSTGFSEYDKLFVVVDQKIISKINNWQPDQSSGIEMFVKEFDQLESIYTQVYDTLALKSDAYGELYYPTTIKQINPQIFAWLSILDMNVWVVLILILLISGFTMVAGLLIIIIEQAPLIGVLKALGSNNSQIRQIFLQLSFYLITKGLLWGNLVGIGICLIQKYGAIFPLDPATYYLSAVPIELNIWIILLINIGVIISTLLMLIAPSYLIAQISPARSVKFE